MTTRTSGVVTRLRFRVDGDLLETMLLETREDIGPELRQEHASDAEAGPSVPFDVERVHCNACKADIADQIGLSHDEVDAISQWREAAKMTPDERVRLGLTSKKLGAILDKIVKRLDHEDDDCDSTTRIVVEVEPTP